MKAGSRNGQPTAAHGLEPTAEALQLFLGLAAELEEGRGNPETLFQSHPELESELRGLYRGWVVADTLLRGLAGDESLVDAIRRGLELDSPDMAQEATLARLRDSAFERRYVLGEELGHGGMGLVRRVTDRTLGRELAMKVIRSVEPAHRRHLLRRFLEEAEVVGRLEHPGIVPIHELGLDPDGQVYFTMPLVRGRTLREILPLAATGSEGWTRGRLIEVLLRVCDAVAYAHSRGVLHRDLKPANVMVGRFGEVYVMDWGLARSLGSRDADGKGARDDDGGLTLAGEVLGTPAYMAPEQALGPSSGLDERCDVYALGAILYEALAGVRPYGDCSSAAALELLVRAAPPPVEELVRGANDELVAIVGRAMARHREERYPSVAAFAGDLRAFLEGRVVRAHRTGPWVEARKWVLRNRGLAVAIGAVVLVLAVGLVVSLVLLRRTERERANVFRLAQTRTLASLIERADGLWPPHPDRIAEMGAWQEEAHALVASLEPDEASGDPGLRAQLAGLAADREAWSEQDGWWHEELAKLVGGIEALADPEKGLLGSGLGPHGSGIGRRVEQAERVRSLDESAATKARWREAREAIRGDPRYARLDLIPQSGLVPLGPDPLTASWEFAHVLSGEIPTRDEAGRLELTDESALVLVLLPPGTFLMGSQIDDPNGPNFTATLTKGEYPAHSRTLDAFFLAKHEMTQAQWAQSTGSNPSTFAASPDARRLPVETLPWNEARLGALRAGLRLPTEAEWEYACRAGTEGEYSWGDDLLDVVRFSNVKNLGTHQVYEAVRTNTVWTALSNEDYRRKEFLMSKDGIPAFDGFIDLAPVGSLLPNAFGLHDLIGNVHEWCEDVYDLYPGARGTEFEATLPPREMRVLRGGAYNRTVVRSAERGSESPEFAYSNTGLRPARSLER